MSGKATILVADPGRPSLLTLLWRIMGAETRGGIDKSLRILGLKKLLDINPEDWSVPDSDFCKQATQYASELCPPFMMRHCFRSYCFGAALASRHGLKLDREVFFVAAMLHDLGLSEKHANDTGSFEWVGARLAHDYCVEAEQKEEVAATIHNAIALHTSVGVADKKEPEVAMLHFGTGMDLFGMRIHEIPGATVEQVLADYSRGNFKSEMSTCLSHQFHHKPDSQFAAAAGIGIIDRIMETLV